MRSALNIANSPSSDTWKVVTLPQGWMQRLRDAATSPDPRLALTSRGEVPPGLDLEVMTQILEGRTSVNSVQRRISFIEGETAAVHATSRRALVQAGHMVDLVDEGEADGLLAHNKRKMWHCTSNVHSNPRALHTPSSPCTLP